MSKRTGSIHFSDHLWPIALLLTAAFTIYWQTLGHEFLFNWDDHYYVINNEAIRGVTPGHLKTAFSTFYVGNYAPVQIISYMIDYSFWGLKAKGFLLTNILLHGLNGVLCYALCCRLLGSRFAAAAAALVFVCHPVQVESVAWVSQRKNLLAMAFFLWAFLLYVRYRERGQTASYLLSVMAFLLALLAKSVAVVFPLVALLYDCCYLEKGQRQGLFVNKAPYFLAAALAGGLALISQSGGVGGGRVPYHGGSPLATFLTMLPVSVTYLRQVVWPVGLSAVYNPPIKSGPDAEVMGAALLLALVTGFMVYLFLRQRQAFFWGAVFAVGLLPVSQLVPIVTIMNDRYLYFPMVGVAGGCGLLLCRFLDGGARNRRLLAGLFVSAIVVPLAVLSIRRAEAWQNPMTFWLDATQRTPDSYAGWFGLGNVHEQRAEAALAIDAYGKALKLCTNRTDCRRPLFNLSGMLIANGDAAAAAPLIQRLIREDPTFEGGYLKLGDFHYFLRADMQAAERAYRKALELHPGMVKVNIRLGDISRRLNKIDAARENYLLGWSAGFQTADLAFNLACAESRLGNYDAAISYLENAARLGLKNRELLMNTPEFTPIRGMSRFRKFVETLAVAKDE